MMQASSPLAAMQPPGFRDPWLQRNDPSDFDTNFLRPCVYEPKNFNFREPNLIKSNSDYFSFKPVRGSSPTASLAVDLSQNFHIDQSPQLPTPRRALFTTTAPPSRSRCNVVTPPIPSSSPGPASDGMDISPLPHKPPHTVVLQVDVCSPTPEATPAEEDPRPYPERACSDSCPVTANSPKQRRMTNPLRPTLKKGYSSSSIHPARRRTSNPANLFSFEANSTFAFNTPLETFAESPPSERKFPPSSNSSSSLLAPSEFESTFQQNGSPLGGPRRPPVARAPLQRAGLGRRSQSVQYSNPHKVARQEKRCCTTGSFQPSIVQDETYKLKLPCFKPEDDPESLPRITKETLVDVMNGLYQEEIGDSTIVDCRFEYEYQGGHISGAVNFNDKEDLAKQLFDQNNTLSKKSALIFHCEYSAHRAPLVAKFVRQRDRAINQDEYPKLNFPEIYILDGGYSDFFRSNSSRCYPQSYVEMAAKEHENACERGLAKVKRRAKLSRAQTYAFGQHSSSIDDKPPSISSIPPVAGGPPVSSNSFTSLESMDIDFFPPAGIKSFSFRPPRRLDSY